MLCKLAGRSYYNMDKGQTTAISIVTAAAHWLGL